jgi:hypothetical protein
MGFLQLRLNDRPLAFTPQQAQEIQALARALAAQATSSEGLQGPVVAVVEMGGDPSAAGILQLAPPQVRWLPRSPGAAPLTGQPDPAQLQGLLEALRQLPER